MNLKLLKIEKEFFKMKISVRIQGDTGLTWVCDAETKTLNKSIQTQNSIESFPLTSPGSVLSSFI